MRKDLLLTASLRIGGYGRIESMHGVIQCRDLRKTYDGKVEAVRGLNLEIQSGECFGLLGPNGAGKTTTIEILEGLLEPTSGEVSILGHRWSEDCLLYTSRCV